MCVQFIIFFLLMMNSFLTRFYNNYAIIYVQNSPNPSYIKYYYNIIRASHGQLSC